MTDPHPDGLGVSTCIELALKDGGVDRDAVNYINAHATSTLVGDKAEIRAIKKVFTGGLKGVKLNGTKSMIGHGLGAAGGLDLPGRQPLRLESLETEGAEVQRVAAGRLAMDAALEGLSELGTLWLQHFR